MDVNWKSIRTVGYPAIGIVLLAIGFFIYEYQWPDESLIIFGLIFLCYGLGYRRGNRAAAVE